MLNITETLLIFPAQIHFLNYNTKNPTVVAWNLTQSFCHAQEHNKALKLRYQNITDFELDFWPAKISTEVEIQNIAESNFPSCPVEIQ